MTSILAKQIKLIINFLYFFKKTIDLNLVIPNKYGICDQDIIVMKDAISEDNHVVHGQFVAMIACAVLAADDNDIDSWIRIFNSAFKDTYEIHEGELRKI
jgi:hypothetical protein